MATRGDALIDYVGSKLLMGGGLLTTTTQWTRAAVLQWLTDGQLELARTLDPSLVQVLVTEKALSGAGSGIADLPTSPAYLKFISARDETNNQALMFVNQAIWSAVKAGTNSQLNFMCTLINDDVYYVPTATSAENIKLIYVSEPPDVADSSNEIALPDELVPLIVDYALIQAKAAEEEISQYSVYMQMWMARVQQKNTIAIARKGLFS